MDKVIVIVGPTGVGKTKLSIELAKKYNGEVISGDSMQVYKGMDIGTAKVREEEKQGVNHYLIDILKPNESYNAASFQGDVRFLIKKITKRGKIPIIVGGTGLYIKAALYDYDFKETKLDTDYYIEKYKDVSNEELFDKLKKIDLQSANDTHVNNRQRVIRALAIYESTGITKTETIKKQKQVCLYDTKFIGLTLDREVLYQRINQRVDKMIDDGLEKEAKSLIDSGLTRDNHSMKAIGYKEWFDYFEGKQDFDTTIELIKQHSRNYAKRQYTWFLNQMDIDWYEVNLDNFDQTIKEIENDFE